MRDGIECDIHMPVMTSTDTWKAWEGRVIAGKFTLGRWLGGSDHSAVFATDWKQQPSQKAVVKLIAQEQAQAQVHLARWRAAAQLSSPHLIRIFESGTCQLDNRALLYVVMEQTDEDLSQVLPIRPLTAAEAGDLLPPILSGLAYLHGKGFVHGRLQPANVHATGDLVKLSSDHIVSINDVNVERRRRDVYDAPESAAGIVSPAGDLWSLGVMLVAVLTQNIPQEVAAGQSDPGVPTSLPQPFLRIARECLYLDPRQRCSIADIRARLSPAAKTAEPATIKPQPASSGVNRKPIYIAAAVLVVIIALWATFKRGSSPPPVAQETAIHEQQTTQQPPRSAAPVSAPAAAAPTSEPTNSPGKVARQSLPEVSPSARHTITGTIRIKVRVEVDASGKVTSARLAAPASSRYFSGHSLDAAKKWEFTPPQRDGQPVHSAWLLQFRISRSSTQASAAPINR